jgi:hypothetical protein
VALDTPTLQVAVAATLTGTAGLGTATLPIALSKSLPMTTGSGAAGTADMIYSTTISLAGSATSDLDFAGVLTNHITGAAMTFARIKAVIIVAGAANDAGNLMQVTRPASNGIPLFMAAGDGIALRPGAFFAWADSGATGVAVTAGTGDLLTFTNSAGTNTITADVVIIGSSA